MLKPPFIIETSLTPEDYQKVGELAIRWAHIEHLAGNCLKTMLRLTEDEASLVVFPLSLDQRVQRMKNLAVAQKRQPTTVWGLAEFEAVMKGVQYVRNNMVHSVVTDDVEKGHQFHLRSKERTLTKEQAFSIEEITNYAAHLVLWLRYAMGIQGIYVAPFPLPDRPEVPEFLRGVIPTQKNRD